MNSFLAVRSFKIEELIRAEWILQRFWFWREMFLKAGGRSQNPEARIKEKLVCRPFPFWLADS
ncbi:MAG: hypothetical protein DMF68_20725 [Acidobacteria bacterium]|nr:MAG: hypothetical protein DMF68_20725 [Acidobacteriota bacterium]